MDSTQKDERPIGLFDSGMGGLTVLRTLVNNFPQESFVYLGDTARLPYGSKSPATIERYVEKNLRFLTGVGVKAVIVACNSASTVLLSVLGGEKKEFSIPVYNVIEPGAAAAFKATGNGRIGVLGTKATVASHAYRQVLMQYNPELTVVEQACPLLVPLVEEGWHDDPLTNLVIYRYLQPVLASDIDTLILGCTHYPALRGGIGRVTGPNIALIDSADAISELLAQDLREGRKLKPASDRKELRLFLTDVSPGFAEVAGRLMRPHSVPSIDNVDIG